MAINVRFHIPYNVNLQQANYVYGHPENVWDTFPVLNEDEFNQRVSVYIPGIVNDRFNQKQYWIRYLMCRGAVIDAMNELIAISQNYYVGIGVANFINYNHPQFNRNTLFHHAVQWCPNVGLIQTMINHGGELIHENAEGNFPEEDIHRTVWFNPFARILNMDMVVHHSACLFDDGDQNSMQIWHVRNETDFHEVIQFIRVHVGEEHDINDNDNENDDVENDNQNDNQNDNIHNYNDANVINAMYNNNQVNNQVYNILDDPNANVNDINYIVAQANNMVNYAN
jgi:hypothetical protein